MIAIPIARKNRKWQCIINHMFASHHMFEFEGLWYVTIIFYRTPIVRVQLKQVSADRRLH